MRLLKTFLLSLMLSCSAATVAAQPRAADNPAATTADQQSAHESALVTEMSDKLVEATKSASNWKTAFWVMMALYVFVYIMGRRRLMRKIWSRNRELREALDKAEESDRMKSAFIRNMSHEIRTPLNAINGFSQLLCSPEYELSEDEKRDMVGRITKNVDNITHIVAELLDMSEGESLHEKVAVSVNKVCARLLDEVKQNDAKGLYYMFESELDDDFTILSSEKNLERIIRHILGNAVKFTDKGSVTMHCRKVNRTLQVAIADTGIGIAPEQRETIFENFVKLNDSADGVGLGLSLSRRLARQLGGDIVLDTTYTGGSRFILTLPLKD